MKLDKLPVKQKVTVRNLLTSSDVEESIFWILKLAPHVQGIICLMDMGDDCMESVRNVGDEKAIHMIELWKIHRLIGDDNE